MAAVGAAFAVVPFVRSWSPSAKARALGAPVRVDISKLGEGGILGPLPAWRGQVVFVIHRPQAVLDRLMRENSKLADPLSKKSTQPEYATNEWRSIRPEIGVFLGLCTHLGCSPQYKGKVEPQPFDSTWKGGFFCPCHGSKFDLAGRVEKNLPAPTNLVVPPYRYESENVIWIGEDPQKEEIA